MNVNAPQNVGVSGSLVFKVDAASWRYAISYMWADQLRDTATIETLGAELEAGDLVVERGTNTLYKLLRPVTSALYFGRKYRLFSVISVNTPRQAEKMYSFYDATLYRVLPKGLGDE